MSVPKHEKILLVCGNGDHKCLNPTPFAPSLEVYFEQFEHTRPMLLLSLCDCTRSVFVVSLVA
jgi:hypothetical protein